MSHTSAEDVFHSLLLFRSPALFYPEPDESSEAFTHEENLTGATDEGETLPRTTVLD